MLAESQPLMNPVWPLSILSGEVVSKRYVDDICTWYWMEAKQCFGISNRLLSARRLMWILSSGLILTHNEMTGDSSPFWETQWTLVLKDESNSWFLFGAVITLLINERKPGASLLIVIGWISVSVISVTIKLLTKKRSEQEHDCWTAEMNAYSRAAWSSHRPWMAVNCQLR